MRTIKLSKFLKENNVDIELFKKNLYEEFNSSIYNLDDYKPEIWIELAFKWSNSYQDLSIDEWFEVNTKWIKTVNECTRCRFILGF
jgi:spore coat protein CotF